MSPAARSRSRPLSAGSSCPWRGRANRVLRTAAALASERLICWSTRLSRWSSPDNSRRVERIGQSCAKLNGLWRANHIPATNHAPSRLVSREDINCLANRVAQCHTEQGLLRSDSVTFLSGARVKDLGCNHPLAPKWCGLPYSYPDSRRR